MQIPSVHISTPNAYRFQDHQIIPLKTQNDSGGGTPASIVDLNNNTKVEINFVSSRESLQYNGGSFDEWKKTTYNIAHVSLFNSNKDALDSEGWEKFYNAALSSGDFIEMFFLATQDLYDFSNESEEFITGFFDLTASLSDEGLSDLFSIYKKSPGDMMQTITTALELEESEIGFTSYLAAANNAGKDISAFNAVINNRIGQKIEKETFGSFLDAAANAGTGVMAFVEFSENLNTKDLKQVSDFLSGLNGADLDNFLQLAEKSKETGDIDTLLDMVDLSQFLSLESRSHLLESALHTRDNGARLVSTAERLGESTGHSAVSNFLSTAANAEDEVGVLIDQASRIDLNFTSTLSKADTIHFLQAARFGGPVLDALAETADGLNGEEKHLFMYAAAKTGNKEDLRALVKNVGNLKGEDLSQFLLKSANKGQGTLDDTIYMKSVLSDEDYAIFKQVASRISGTVKEQFKEITLDLSDSDRSEFMLAARDAEEDTASFISMFDMLDYESRKTLLEISSHLDAGDGMFRKDFIKNITNSTNPAGYLSVMREKLDNDPSEFDLRAMSFKSQIEGITSILERVDDGQKNAFMFAAATSDEFFGMLSFYGKKLLDNEPDNFSHVIMNIDQHIGWGLGSI